MYRAKHVHLVDEQYYRTEFKINGEWYPVENALKQVAKFAVYEVALSAAANAYNKAMKLKKD